MKNSMENRVLRGKDAAFGCDFALALPHDRRQVRILQLTDMQVIDSSQRRVPDRLRADEIEAWTPDRFDALCGDHVRSLVAQAKPDLIILTGDLVYGSFDDSGSTFSWFCRMMDSLGVPWAPVFGNHDNESRRGVDWQCEMLSGCQNCLFRRGDVTGNGNYSIALVIGERLVRVIHMVDSNGCKGSDDPAVTRECGIYPDQLASISETTEAIRLANGDAVPAFMAFQIPTVDFREVEYQKGYRTDERTKYTIGVDVPSSDGDFGFQLETHRAKLVELDGFTDFLHETGIDGVFVGHFHATSTVIDYAGVRWVYGLKTGQYDYHVPGQLGGTLITLADGGFTVMHLPSLVHYAPMPCGAEMFRGFFADGKE